MHTDASTTGLGAVLYQKQSDGKERVIAYDSWSLNHVEQIYDAHKLEFLALKWAVTDRFHKYLYGGTFDVCTDKNPLTYILTTAKLDAMGNRWVASLGPYHFNLNYKPGKLNSDTDALSRIDWRSVMAEEVKATIDLAQVDRTVIVESSVFEDTLEFGLNCVYFWPSGGHNMVFSLFCLAFSLGILVSLCLLLFLGYSQQLVTWTGLLEM